MPRDSNGAYSLPAIYLATTGQTVLASQHNTPLEDLGEAITASIPRDGSAPMLSDMDMGGFKVTNAGAASAGTDLVTKAAMDAAVALLTAQLVPTGALQYFARTTAPTGWLVVNGMTIGNGASGGTARANSDTEDLYTILWESFSNTLLPIQDSSGSASTRGASAAADYAANKRLPLPDDQGLFLRALSTSSARDTGRAFGSVQEDEFQSHTHEGTTETDGNHTHTVPTGGIGGGSVAQTGPTRTGDAITTTGTGAHAHEFTTDATGGTETRPMNRAYLLCIKL